MLWRTASRRGCEAGPPWLRRLYGLYGADAGRRDLPIGTDLRNHARFDLRGPGNDCLAQKIHFSADCFAYFWLLRVAGSDCLA